MDLFPFPLDDDLRRRLLETAVALALILGVRTAALRLVRAKVADVDQRYRWRKGVNYVLLAAALLAIGRVWSSGVGQLGTFLGLVTAGLAVALRDPLTNVAGWLFILWRRPLRIGDRVQIQEFSGDVVDIRLFQFSLLETRGDFAADQPTGRIVHLPNALVFTTPQVNATDAFPFIWTELPITLTFESDWEKAKAAFVTLAESHFSASADVGRTLHARYALGALDFAPAVYTSVAADGVTLTLRGLCPVRRERGVRQTLWEAVLRTVAGWDNVDFAYPTTRFYDNRTEGKPAARADGPTAPANRPV